MLEQDALVCVQNFLQQHSTLDAFGGVRENSPTAQLVAHNATAKLAFLRNWFLRHRAYFPASPRPLCIMQRAAWLLYEDVQMTPVSNYRLATLADYFGVEIRQTVKHDLLTKVEANLAIYRALQRWMPRSSAAIPARQLESISLAANAN
ncbi:hypothetical protein [Rubripirellula tenax]|uniref:hypothetical protein n=1 Tax=Rubripirellula tenax TaxID=2528015 RepID=UPI0011B508DA|nr:hypothetical protein [Rubripirellula tenax]